MPQRMTRNQGNQQRHILPSRAKATREMMVTEKRTPRKAGGKRGPAGRRRRTGAGPGRRSMRDHTRTWRFGVQGKTRFGDGPEPDLFEDHGRAP